MRAVRLAFAGALFAALLLQGSLAAADPGTPSSLCGASDGEAPGLGRSEDAPGHPDGKGNPHGDDHPVFGNGTPGNAPSHSNAGGNAPGHSNAGGNSGNSNAGGNAPGHSNAGGNSGNSNAGGNAPGHSNAGGNAPDHSNAGGSSADNSNAGGADHSNGGGASAGNSNAGGSSAGHSNAGGDTDNSNAGSGSSGKSNVGGNSAGHSNAGGNSDTAGGSSSGNSNGGGNGRAHGQASQPLEQAPKAAKALPFCDGEPGREPGESGLGLGLPGGASPPGQEGAGGAGGDGSAPAAAEEVPPEGAVVAPPIASPPPTEALPLAAAAVAVMAAGSAATAATGSASLLGVVSGKAGAALRFAMGAVPIMLRRQPRPSRTGPRHLDCEPFPYIGTRPKVVAATVPEGSDADIVPFPSVGGMVLTVRRAPQVEPAAQAEVEIQAFAWIGAPRRPAVVSTAPSEPELVPFGGARSIVAAASPRVLVEGELLPFAPAPAAIVQPTASVAPLQLERLLHDRIAAEPTVELAPFNPLPGRIDRAIARALHPQVTGAPLRGQVLVTEVTN